MHVIYYKIDKNERDITNNFDRKGNIGCMIKKLCIIFQSKETKNI